MHCLPLNGLEDLKRFDFTLHKQEFISAKCANDGLSQDLPSDDLRRPALLDAGNYTGPAILVLAMTSRQHPAHPSGTANKATVAAAAAASSSLLNISDTIDRLLSLPSTNLIEGADLLTACQHLRQLFPGLEPTNTAPVGRQQKQLAVRALNLLKLPRLLAKLLAASPTQPVDQPLSSKWQHPGYLRAVLELLFVHHNLFRYYKSVDTISVVEICPLQKCLGLGQRHSCINGVRLGQVVHS